MADSDTKNYDAKIVELSEWYDLAKENKDNKQFYVYLYAYVDTIYKDQQILLGVNQLWAREIVNSPPDDKRRQIFNEPSRIIEKHGRITEAHNLILREEMMHAIESSRIKETQFTYCWLMLSDGFYKIYRDDITNRSIQKVSKIDPKDMKTYSNKQKAFLKEVETIYKLEDITPQERAKIEKINQSVINFEHLESQDVYITCLSLVHKKLIVQLTKNAAENDNKPKQLNPKQVINDSTFKPTVQPQVDDENTDTASLASSNNPQRIPDEQQQAELVFHGQTTPIVSYQGYEYVFESLDENYDPWKIISYCWTYMLDKEVSLNELQKDADVNAPRGVKEALRKSPLFVKTKNKKGALSPFLKGLSKQYITVLRYTPLTNDELKIIENVAIDKTKS